jgi:archaellum component FlaC
VGPSPSDVVVERDLERKNGGIVGTVRLRSTGQTPVLARVEDEFPDSLPVDQVGFRPGAEPEAGNVGPEGAVFEQPLGDDPVTIEYGITLAEAVEKVQFDPPVVRDVVALDQQESPVPRTDGGEQSSESGAVSTGATRSSRSLSSILPMLGDERSEAEPTDGDDPDESAAAEQPSVAVDAADAAIDPAVEQDGGDGAAAHTESDRAPSDAEQAAPDVASASGRRGPSANGDRRGDRDTDVARSVELRIDRLSARVQEFETYATALQELIDTHGTGPEIVERMNAEFDAVDDELQSVRAELETLSEQRAETVAELTDRADAVEDRLDETHDALSSDIDDVRTHLDDELARIDTELATRDTTLDSLDDRVTTLETDVQGVHETVLEVQAEFASVADDVEAMRDELASLRAEVEEIAAVRDSLATVFEPAGDERAGDT